MARLLALAWAAAFALASAGALADFRAVGEEGAILYDGPSRQATPLFVVSRDYPLEVIAQTDAWVKVRDHTGALSWIERRRLGERRTVLVTAPLAEAKARPEDAAPVAFSAVRDVALEYLGPAAGGWVRVRHAEGTEGYVRASAVWGE
ncbi:MAG: SH3 domain-containing protein [Betaproteobacteria bacterium]|nr:SH3 domain-containing protein [Betaproteobacteria bacterium]